MTLAQLLQAAELLPPGSSVTLTREALLEALGDGALQTSGNPAPPPGDRTVLELAAQFRRKPSTIRDWLEHGRFPGAYKLNGRDWRVPLDVVEAFVAGERGTGPRDGAQLGAWRKHRRRA